MERLIRTPTHLLLRIKPNNEGHTSPQSRILEQGISLDWLSNNKSVTTSSFSSKCIRSNSRSVQSSVRICMP
jgi:hypothetical protein